MADVFLSYKKEDRDHAIAVVDALRKSGKTVWWDDGLTPRQAWDATIEREIADAASVVVLWSPRSVMSDWVRTEAHYGQDKNKLVPVLIEPCAIPLAFMLKQAVDLSNWRGSTADARWRKLLEWLDEDRPTTAQRPLPPPVRRFRPTNWRPVISILAALIVVGGSITGWLAARSHTESGGAPTVRVTALTMPSGDAAAASFSQGFAADLAQIVTSGGSKLRVVDGTGPGAATVGDSDFTLAGNVRAAAGMLRATLTLNSAEDGTIIWSTKLERPIADADAMHQEAEVKMGAVFVCALDEAARDRSIVPLDALKVYLQACEALPSGEEENARKLLRDVTRLAPSFAQGWATLAEWNGFSIENDDDPAKAGVDRKEALDAANRALALDPHNATAWTARSMTKVKMSEWLSAQADLDRAFVLNPDEPIGNYFAAAHLRNVGRLGEALEHAQRGANSGPRFWPKTLQVIQITADLGDADGAMKMLVDARKTWPDENRVKKTMLDVATKYLDPKQAAVLLNDQTLTGFLPPSRLKLYKLELAVRTSPTSTNVAAANAAIDAEFLGPDNILGLLGHLVSMNRTDDAYAALHELRTPLYNAPYMPNPASFFAPEAATLRADPRFIMFARQQGLLAVWRATGKWPDFCTTVDPPYNCKAILTKN